LAVSAAEWQAVGQSSGRLPAKSKTFADRLRTDPLSTIVTVSIDVLSASVASFIGLWWSVRDHDVVASPWMALLYVPLLICTLAILGIYRRRLNRRFLNEIGPVETGAALASMVLLTALELSEATGDPAQTVIRVWACAGLLIPLGRLIRVAIQRRIRRNHHLVSPTLVVGGGTLAALIIERLQSNPQYGLDPVGLLDGDAPADDEIDNAADTVPYLGNPDHIAEAIERTGAECAVIAFSRLRDEQLADVVRVAHRYGLRVWVIPRMFDAIGERSRIDHIGGLPVLDLPRTNPHGWQFAVKHVFDRVSATLGLLMISPLFLTLMALVKLSSRGPVFFKQPRVGRDGKVFDCLKFRTMRETRPSDAAFIPETGSAPGGVEGVDRRTWIGKILRATSMDELPQLINVIRGEMSLVGPRPERPEFVELFAEQVRRYGDRHRVKAGITGWAQVHGLRGQTSIADRAEWDNYYIENWSLALDIKTLLMTVVALFRGAE
jgi:exopolysaccharide biosynthesis polyprenyl glycosylphosphotransferase